jgi:hypothetical protein
LRRSERNDCDNNIHRPLWPAVQEPVSDASRKTASANTNSAAAFVSDFLEDVLQRQLQPAALAKQNMFREHLLAMSIAYCALIAVLAAASLPVLAYLIRY